MSADRIAGPGPGAVRREPLTLAELRRLIDELCRTGSHVPTLAETVAILEDRRLPDLQLGKVLLLLSTVSKLRAGHADAAALTPRQLEDLLAEIS